MALIYLLSGLALGAALARRIPFPLYLFERVAMAVILGLFSWTWLAFLVAIVLPYDVALPIVVTASAAATVALWSGGRLGLRTAGRRPLEGGRRAWVAWGIATATTGALLARLFWTHSLDRDKEGIWSAAASWADYGLHASIITHIAAATSLPSDLPIASGEKITYPYLIDLLSGFYVQGGFSLQPSLFWPGILLSLAFCQLMIAFGLRLFGRVSVGIGALGLALTVGSAAGAWTAWSDWRESGKGLFSFLGDLPSDYSAVADANANVTNLLVDGLIPQRSMLFGLGVGLVVLIFLHASREREEPKLLWPVGVLVGLLPMAHPHTFMVTGGLLAAFAAEAAWRKRAIPVDYLKPLGLAVLIALPQLLWQQLANDHGTGGRFRFGWMLQDGASLPGYWWANFGLIGIAFLVIPFAMRKHHQVVWFLPMLVVLAITQLYAFQPFEYDNLKLIWWVYIVAGFFISYLVAELVRRHRAWLVLVLPLAVFTLAPGVLSIVRELQQRDMFATLDDIAAAKWTTDNTPPDAVFASVNRPNPPVATLAGRSLVTGYSGWMFNFSIPDTERQAAVRAGLDGRFDDPLLRKFSADYLLVATNEDPAWPSNETALASKPVAYQNPTWRIYKLQ